MLYLAMTVRPFLTPLLAIAALALAFAASSCDSAALKADRAQVQQQQEQIEQNAREIAELKAQQSYQASVPPPPGSCDREVMNHATRQAGQKYADGDFSRALGYYQDALAACPGNARAELNVARTYEALKNREQALLFYQRAASTTDPAEQSAKIEAQAALGRLNGTL